MVGNEIQFLSILKSQFVGYKPWTASEKQLETASPFPFSSLIIQTERTQSIRRRKETIVVIKPFQCPTDSFVIKPIPLYSPFTKTMNKLNQLINRWVWLKLCRAPAWCLPPLPLSTLVWHLVYISMCHASGRHMEGSPGLWEQVVSVLNQDKRILVPEDFPSQGARD